jgi:hypothetical protein
MILERHKHEQVNADREANSKPAVHPKQYNHASLQPLSDPGHVNPILTDVDQDDTKADNGRGDEQRFGRM